MGGVSADWGAHVDGGSAMNETNNGPNVVMALPGLALLLIPAAVIGWLFGWAAGVVGYLAFVAGLVIGDYRPEGS